MKPLLPPGFDTEDQVRAARDRWNNDKLRVPNDLLDSLEVAFPAKDITPTSTPAEIMYQAGQRSVIASLRRKQAQGTD